MSDTQGARAARQGAARDRLNYFNYFTEIEDAFIRRRGKHLLLSPMDWALMDSWKRMGVPLHVVLRGVESAFDSYESKPRKRTVKSLYYCQEEVEAQYAEWLEGQRGANAKTGDAAHDAGAAGDVETNEPDEAAGLPFPRAVIAAHLAECREALARAGESRRREVGEDELCEALARAAARLAELEADFARAARPDAQALEDSLTDLEALLDRAVRAPLPAPKLAAKRAHAAEQLEPYRARMERATYEQTLDNLLAKALREEYGVPRLSLFYL
ncbi:MAG TPA: hypothetical protein VF064_18240 [Pyrinomonadaceae bacterium]